MMSAGPPISETAAGRVAETARVFLRTFSRPGRLLIAISGGSDSTALLLAFHLVLREPEFAGFSLSAITVDHRLRPGSTTEAAAVASLCKGLAIPHLVLPWEGEKPATALQEKARIARYRLLAEAAAGADAIAVLTGHTADDQRETITMRGRRGQGPGLAGMAPVVLLCEKAWLLRPFLGLSRADLRAALTAWGQTWLEDPSNANASFERVRLRAEEPARASRDGEGPSGSEPEAGGEDGPDDPAVGPGQEARLASAFRQRDWLLAHARVAGGSVAIIAAEALAGPLTEAAALALFRLQAAIGGRVFPPALASRLRVLAFLETGKAGRMTVGGTVFDRRRDALYLYRESRGLQIRHMKTGEELYDGRYRLAGRPGPSALVGPAPVPDAHVPALEAQGLPKAIARRAAPAIACLIGPAPGGALDDAACVSLERRIAAYAGFLPGFDLPVARTLRQLFGLAPVPEPPVRQ